jgi:formylglycine-generating enzyme required for sulfatase activity
VPVGDVEKGQKGYDRQTLKKRHTDRRSKELWNIMKNLVVLKGMCAGFVVGVCLLAAHVGAAPITYEEVIVGNPGNANDTGGSGMGRVDYTYQIGKYDVTISQYTAFLNAVAATADPYSLWNEWMAINGDINGISRYGSAGSYWYAEIGSGNRPITYVSWFDAARFSNWMTNGQGNGDTETGAYTLNGAVTGNAVAKNPGAAFSIPTQDEWYKAAYYSPALNDGGGGYYAYATQSNALPDNIIGGAANQANYYGGNGYCVTQSINYYGGRNYLTDVGVFSGSGSFYGTFDQSGNVNQWTDLDGTAGSTLSVRGGFWAYSYSYMSSSVRFAAAPSQEDGGLGFRLASPFGVPEIDPSRFGSALALVLGSLGLLERRRAR